MAGLIVSRGRLAVVPAAAVEALPEGLPRGHSPRSNRRRIWLTRKADQLQDMLDEFVDREWTQFAIGPRHRPRRVPELAAEAHRQSAAVAAGDQAFIDALSLDDA